MKSSFESLIEDLIPEINFLTTAGADLKPGHVLESREKDTVVAYLPDYLKETPLMNSKSFETTEELFDIRLEKVSGKESNEAAAKVLKQLGIKFEENFKYKVTFDIEEITSIKFSENLDKISFEIALKQLKKGNDKSIFRRLKGHFLVLRVLYATRFKIKVEIDRGSGFDTHLDLKDIKVDVDAKVEKEENSIVVGNRPSVPFGVIGYEIRANRLK